MPRKRADLRDEYDFRGGVRGKYAERYAKGTDVERLDPDVALAFPTAEEVNDALRAHLAAGQRARR